MSRLTIGARLALGFLVVVAFLIIDGVQGLWALKQSNQGLHTVYEDQVVPIKGLKVIADAYAVNIIDAVNKANAGLMSGADALKQVKEARAMIDREWTAYKSTDMLPEEAKMVQEATALYGPANEAIARLAAALEANPGSRKGSLDEFDGPLYQTIDPISGKISELIEMQLREADETNRQVQAEYQQTLYLTGMLMAVAVAISVWLAVSITRSIVRPVREAVQIANTVAAGDLGAEVRVSGNDEVAQLLRALDAMSQSLRRVVGEVRTGSEQMATASSEIAAGNADLSRRTEAQAASVEQTASSMEQLMASVKQNADTALQANRMTESASAAAIRGGEVVGTVVQTMQQISASSRKITEILGVIDGIAFQTNILALNAAVEAARAGDAGRGFAVVAGEVRTLAQRSAEAAKEIKGLIAASVSDVEEGTRQVAQAGDSVREIVEQVQRITDLINDITAATREQSEGVGQVGDAIMQLDQVTQQNAALVEQSAAAAASLSQQAARLTEAVGAFRLGAQHALSRPAVLAPAPRVSAAPASTAKPRLGATPAAAGGTAAAARARPAALARPPALAAPAAPTAPRSAATASASPAPAPARRASGPSDSASTASAGTKAGKVANSDLVDDGDWDTF